MAPGYSLYEFGTMMLHQMYAHCYHKIPGQKTKEKKHDTTHSSNNNTTKMFLLPILEPTLAPKTVATNKTSHQKYHRLMRAQN